MTAQGSQHQPQPAAAEAVLQHTADHLAQVLLETAAAVVPFPAFYGSEVIKALELETPTGYPDRGCVVICPDGQLYELDIGLIPAPTDVGGVDGVELFRDLDLPPAEYVAYACLAVQALAERLAPQKSAR
ncbi:MAG: hypothetical protein EXR47_01355 [Dehalococcoidia bacterium]|nr:hypothetical protein [Dehalococcoidia bacterium]